MINIYEETQELADIRDKVYLEGSFFNERDISICDYEMTFKNIGFNMIEFQEIYEVIGKRKQLVAISLYKVLNDFGGNVLFFTRYNDLYEFTRDNFNGEVNCNEIIKEVSKLMIREYAEKFSNIIGKKVIISEASIGNGLLENILDKYFMDDSIFSSEIFIVQGMVQKEFCQCEYFAVYISDSEKIKAMKDYVKVLAV